MSPVTSCPSPSPASHPGDGTPPVSPTVARERAGCRWEISSPPEPVTVGHSGAGHRVGRRRPSRRHRVRLWCHPGQMGSDRLPVAPSGPHRRLEGQLGPGRRPRSAGGRAHARSAGPRPTSSTAIAARVPDRDDRVLFLGRVDGELENGVDERREVARIIRTLQPDRRAGPRPLAPIPAASRPPRRRLPHPRRTGGRTGSAFLPRTRAGPPPTGGRCSCSKPTEPNHVEDAAGFEDTKVEALLCHRSQWESTMGHRRGRRPGCPTATSDDGSESALPPRSGGSWPTMARWPDSMRPRPST